MVISSFSGGRTSAYMTYLLRDKIDLAIFCNTGREDEGTLVFVKRCSEYFDIPIIWLEYEDSQTRFKEVTFETANREGKPFDDCIKRNSKKGKTLPNALFRFCTVEMKIKTIKRYLKSNGFDLSDIDMLIGIRYDEPKRYHKKKGETRNGWEVLMPLYDMQITKPMVIEWWRQQPFDLELSHPEAGNCDLCFLKGFKNKVFLLQQQPARAEWWQNHEQRTGNSFHKDYTIADCLEYSQKPFGSLPSHKKKRLQNIFDQSYDIECHCNID